MLTRQMRLEINARKVEKSLIKKKKIRRPWGRRRQLRREIAYWEKKLRRYRERKLIRTLAKGLNRQGLTKLK